MTGATPDGDWIPLYLDGGVAAPSVNWAYVGRERFTEPFFWDTAMRLARQPFNQLFRPRSTMAELVARAEALPGLPLTGLVFHTSRCGSTLAARALASLPDSVVLSEPGPLDALLRILHADRAPALPERLAWLRALVAALGQPRRAGDRRLFIKLDSWHMGWFPLLRAAFPETPWLFIHRDPLAVLASQQRQTGLTALPGHVPESLLCGSPEELSPQTPVHQGTRVVRMILLAAAQALAEDHRGLAIDYRDLPDALWTTMAAHFGLALGAGERDAMRAVCGQDSKRPGQSFEADAGAGRARAGDDLGALAERWLMEPYRALERRRGG